MRHTAFLSGIDRNVIISTCPCTCTTPTLVLTRMMRLRHGFSVLLDLGTVIGIGLLLFPRWWDSGMVFMFSWILGLS